ncbi:MAG: hypothetical protein ACE5D3_01480, partial [Candidatus Binatia bacterium]
MVTAAILLASLVTTFGITTLVLVYMHPWTDALLSHIPMFGPATSLAADPSLLAQMRTSGGSAYATTINDRKHALVLAASVTNDSLVPVTNIVLGAEAWIGGRSIASATELCGKVVPARLIRRLSTEDLKVLAELPPPPSFSLLPGQSADCQVTFRRAQEEIEEVSFRIVSVEPLPGHLPPRFHYPE